MNKKNNNKGFSLVELIIVIAIMVILVAVIAPQYLKFVNNSRVSADIQTAADMATAINVAVADGKAPFSAANTVDWSKVDNMTAAPASKFGTTWAINGDNTVGVTSITLDGDEIYPDSDAFATAHNE